MSQINILFGTQTGNAHNLANVIGDSLANAGFDTVVSDMGERDPESIHDMDFIIIVTSTHGDGEPPDNASEWMSYLKFNEEIELKHLHYAVLGLGDNYYPHFCQCGKDFDEYLSKRGGHSLTRRLDCDLYYEEQYPEWLSELINVLKNKVQE
jgi:sulfite reductase (NADPH) flavoprotein alpha-component